MPYCIADGFAQYLLCKTKQNQTTDYTSFLNGNGSIYTGHGQEVLT